MEQRIYRLWDELADFDAAKPDAALNHLLRGLCDIAGAQNAVWFAGVRMPEAGPQDRLKGWRPRGRHTLAQLPEQQEQNKLIESRVEAGQVDITTLRNISWAGRLRANRLCDLVGEDWFASNYYQVMYRRFGINDAIWAGCPVNQDTEVYIGLYRYHDHGPFQEHDRAWVEAGLRGLKWFHRQQLLSRGLILAESALTPTERDVLVSLLEGNTEKFISRSLEQSIHTTHGHVKSIYRKFGVSNRARLLSLWLGLEASQSKD